MTKPPTESPAPRNGRRAIHRSMDAIFYTASVLLIYYAAGFIREGQASIRVEIIGGTARSDLLTLYEIQTTSAFILLAIAVLIAAVTYSRSKSS